MKTGAARCAYIIPPWRSATAHIENASAVGGRSTALTGSSKRHIFKGMDVTIPSLGAGNGFPAKAPDNVGGTEQFAGAAVSEAPGDAQCTKAEDETWRPVNCMQGLRKPPSYPARDRGHAITAFR